MAYAVKEIFYTLQGEGANAGRPAVFCRFAGCNLWSGREEGRAEAVCRFCDTDFVGTDGLGGGSFADAGALADPGAAAWGGGGGGEGGEAGAGGWGGGGAGAAGVAAAWEGEEGEEGEEAAGPARFTVLTGGEPLLQLDPPLLAALDAQIGRAH